MHDFCFGVVPEVLTKRVARGGRDRHNRPQPLLPRLYVYFRTSRCDYKTRLVCADRFLKGRGKQAIIVNSQPRYEHG